MAYAPQSKENTNLQKQQQPVRAVAQAFSDNRESTTSTLQLQELMANSPQQQKRKATAQLMANSAVQQRLNTTAQLFANKPEPLQRFEDEEPPQTEAITMQRAENAESAAPTKPPEPKPSNTGLPNQLKAGIESLSGMSMDHVKVHYNSDKPAQLQAHAYAQGSEIHVAPGQEQHLPHEAWHVVQQAQGRVKPTVQMKGGVQVNDDVGLETEADLMGGRAVQQQNLSKVRPTLANANQHIVQRAAAAPDSGNAGTYDLANIAATVGAGASTSVEVKTTIANKNASSAPVAPVNANYMLQDYEGDYKSGLLTTTVTDTGGAVSRTYVPTKWHAYFNWDINKGHTLTQTHIIHHSLAADANNNGNNIAWANAYLNNTAWWPALLLGPKPRSVADREHEDKNSLNSSPFGRGGKTLVSHLYNSAYKIRPYNGAWYTLDNTMGVDTVKVPSSDLVQVANNTFPLASTIYQLQSGRYCMWYKSVPIYNTAKNYADNIRTNMQAAYNARVLPQHGGEELTDPAWFDNVGTEIANAYASGFRIDSQFYQLGLKLAGFYSAKTDYDLKDMVYWVTNPVRSETINDPSPSSGGMQVQITYAAAVKSTDADKIEKGVIHVFGW